jgi:hypothetical protein
MPMKTKRSMRGSFMRLTTKAQRRHAGFRPCCSHPGRTHAVRCNALWRDNATSEENIQRIRMRPTPEAAMAKPSPLRTPLLFMTWIAAKTPQSIDPPVNATHKIMGKPIVPVVAVSHSTASAGQKCRNHCNAASHARTNATCANRDLLRESVSFIMRRISHVPSEPLDGEPVVAATHG